MFERLNAPELQRLQASRSQRRAVLGAPAVVVAGLFLVLLHAMNGTVPGSWFGVAVVAFVGLLSVATILVWQSLEDLDRYDESPIWSASVAAAVVTLLLFGVALTHAETLGVDPTRGPMQPKAEEALTALAAAVGAWFASGAFLGMALAASALYGWADGRRWRYQREHPHRVAADAYDGAAQLLLLLASDRGALGASVRDVHHLLRVGRRVTKVAIRRAARLDVSKGRPRRELLRTVALLDAGLDGLEGAPHRTRVQKDVLILRRLATSVRGEKWLEIEHVLGPVTRNVAARQDRERKEVLGLVGALLVCGATFFFAATRLSPVMATFLVALRSTLVGLALMRAVAVARRGGWLASAEEEATLRRVAAGLLGAVRPRFRDVSNEGDKPPVAGC